MIQLIIEGLVAIFVVSLQFYFFGITRTKIREVETFFPDADWDETDILPVEVQGQIVQTLNENEFRGKFAEMTSHVNKFLRKNRGTAEFSIIKNIIERRIENLENTVSSNISLPLYIGLMGTFIGIITGLVFIAFGKGLDMDKDINGLLGGVVIAMVASFIGLLLTVRNNSYHFKNAKEICDEAKIKFFDFLQEELMPHMGNSLFDALDNLKTNINAFNTTFKENVKLFDTSFSENINSLKTSVASLSGNMEALVDNTKSQQEFLQELKKLGQLNIAKTNAQIYQLLTDLIPHLIGFQQQQEKLNGTVANANGAALSIERIMDRLKSFEESLQNLGPVIDNRKFLGNEILVRIDKNLKGLDRDYKLLTEHELTATEQITAHFNAQYQQIRRLTDQIKTEVEDALNMKIADNPLKKLLLLDSLDKHLKEISDKITTPPTPLPAFREPEQPPIPEYKPEPYVATQRQPDPRFTEADGNIQQIRQPIKNPDREVRPEVQEKQELEPVKQKSWFKKTFGR
jgi:biopolymer transport protein ExbB/TolQ/archaellum component FlaC